ncbi:MAG: DUF3881 family protein [Blastocatellia bacterium]
MAEPFEAIGFRVKDAASYEALAEEAHQHGAISLAQRQQGVLHGCCWSLGSGLEVWTMLFESQKGLVYTDCRPGFRCQRLLSFYPWEIIEYEEDGEALARGLMPDMTTEVFFSLQNITEIDPLEFRDRPITAAVSGLAYNARVSIRRGKQTFAPLSRKRDRRRNATGSDYAVRGTILSWREMTNPQTTETLFWIDVSTGQTPLEIIINRTQLKGELKTGGWLSAEVWLQGHILNDKELSARYEGIDRQVSQGDLWIKLRREN